MTPQQIAVAVVAATLGLLILLLLLYGRPRRSLEEPLPPNFSRGDPDSVLEGSRLNKMLVWAFASSLFITAFLVVYFVVEPFRQVSYSEAFHEVSVTRGERVWFEAAECAACHGAGGEGAFAETDTSWPAPPLNNVMYRMTRTEVQRIVEAGREGTPMPPWAIAYGGPLNDAMIEDVMNFIESIQVPEEEQFELPEDVTDAAEVFQRKCAVCHGPQGRGQPMGHPFPTFYAFDLTTSFYRLGVPLARNEVERQLLIETGEEPTTEQVDEAFAALTAAQITEAGEESVRRTVERGRPHTPMPAWMNRIMPEQIDAVMEFLRGIQRVPEGGAVQQGAG